jgi:hypothetical protein
MNAAPIFIDPDVANRRRVYTPLDGSGHVTEHGRHQTDSFREHVVLLSAASLRGRTT